MRAATSVRDPERERLATIRKQKAQAARFDERYTLPIVQALQRLLCRETVIRMAYGEMDDN